MAGERTDLVTVTRPDLDPSVLRPGRQMSPVARPRDSEDLVGMAPKLSL